MGISYQIHHDNKALYATADGPITLNDIRNHLFKERLENGLPYAELIDARTATPAFSSEEVRIIVTILRDFAKEHTLGPTAVVVGTDLGFGIIRMLEILVEDACAVRPFRDIDAALQWLREARLTSASNGRSTAITGAHARTDSSEKK